MGRSALPAPLCGTDSSQWDCCSDQGTSLARGLFLRAAVLIRVAVARCVGGVARRELAGGEVGIRRSNPLLQLLDLEARPLLLLSLVVLLHDAHSFCEKRTFSGNQRRVPGAGRNALDGERKRRANGRAADRKYQG